MITIRRKRLLYIGLPILILFFLLNHLEYSLRCAGASRARGGASANRGPRGEQRAGA